MKKIFTFILLTLYLVCSSGIVVFAYDCSLLRHTHYSLLKEISCMDIDDEVKLHINNATAPDYNMDDEDDCCCHLSQTAAEIIPDAIKISPLCGENDVKTLLLDTDIEVMQNFKIFIKFIKSFLSADISSLQFDTKTDIVKINNYLFSNHFTKISSPWQLILVQYIQTQSNYYSPTNNIT